MFDPIYATEVLNDILSRHGLQLVLTPKEDAPPKDGEQAKNKETQKIRRFPQPVSLRTARLSAGFTQSRAERQMGYSKGTLSRWEAGIHKPSPIKLRQLCQLYGISDQDIVLESPEA